MSEVVGKAFTNKMVLVQGTKGVLENGVLRAGAEGLQQFGKVRGTLLANAQQVRGRVEVKRLACGSFRVVNVLTTGHVHRYSANLPSG